MISVPSALHTGSQSAALPKVSRVRAPPSTSKIQRLPGSASGVMITTRSPSGDSAGAAIPSISGPIDSPIGPIEPGRVAAQRFTWQGCVRGEPVVTARTNWFMGEEHLDPPWSFGPEGERFEVEVTGDPSSKVTFHGWHPESIQAGLARNPGIVATAIHGVSAIPAVCRAAPGIRTYLDLPLVAGRAAPELAS